MLVHSPFCWLLAVSCGVGSRLAGPDLFFLASADEIKPIFNRTWNVVPVPEERRKAVRDTIERAATQYPPGFSGAFGRGVYVASELSVDGLALGGIARADARLIVLAVSDNGRFDDPWIRLNFHHEVAHVLLENHRDAFPKERWVAQNPAGFAYGSPTGMDALRSGAEKIVSDEEARRAGFANAYGRTNLDEDVASVAALVMSSREESVRQIRGYPWLLRKCALLIEFYGKLDPAFKPPEGWREALR